MLLCVALFLAFAAFAQDAGTPPALPDGAVDAITGVVLQLASKFPKILTVLVVVGGLRVMIKPLIAALHAYADYTDTPKDNELIAKIENSKALKTMLFVLDLICSIKVRK